MIILAILWLLVSLGAFGQNWDDERTRYSGWVLAKRCLAVALWWPMFAGAVVVHIMNDVDHNQGKR